MRLLGKRELRVLSAHAKKVERACEEWGELGQSVECQYFQLSILFPQPGKYRSSVSAKLVSKNRG